MLCCRTIVLPGNCAADVAEGLSRGSDGGSRSKHSAVVAAATAAAAAGMSAADMDGVKQALVRAGVKATIPDIEDAEFDDALMQASAQKERMMAEFSGCGSSAKRLEAAQQVWMEQQRQQAAEVNALQSTVKALQIEQKVLEAKVVAAAAENERRKVLEKQLLQALVGLQRQQHRAERGQEVAGTGAADEDGELTEELKELEELVRRFGGSEQLLPIPELPALYASVYGRHRPLSSPGWEDQLHKLRTCHVVSSILNPDGTNSVAYVVWCGDDC